MDEALALRTPERSKTVGFLVAWLGDRYATAVVAGASDVFRERGYNLMVFSGNTLGSTTKFEVQGNILYELVNQERLDALIVLSGSLVNTIGIEKFAEFCQRYHPLTMVSIAVPLPNVPTVFVEAESGMRHAIEHLIVVHGHRRIAFIKGPSHNAEAARRLNVYTDVLAQHGIELDDELMVPGNFNSSSGEEAVSLLLDHRMVDFTAIAAANDTMAIAAIEALQARGISVPNDVAVVGYDDVDEAKFINPPLTTVRQPLYRQGRVAAEMILARMRGEVVASEITLPTQMVVRQSCGCRYAVPRSRSLVPNSKDRAIEDVLEQDRQEIILSMSKPVESTPLGTMVDPLLTSFVNDLLDPSSDKCTQVLEEILAKAAIEGDVNIWQEVISAMRREVQPMLTENRYRVRAEDLWQQMRVEISDVAQRAQAQQRIVAEKRARTLGTINQSLIQSIDVTEVAEVVGRGLPLLDIRGCYLSLYEGAEHPPEWSKLILSYDTRNRVRIHAAGLRFPTRMFIPEQYWPYDRTWTAVVQPLYFRKEQLGFVVFDVDIHAHESSFYEELREQLSSALKRVRREQDLTRLREAESQRAKELEDALTALRENQQKLIHSEKMASLGRLTAGVAHEMNTPIAAVRMAIEELRKLTTEYRESIGDASVTVDDHREIAKEMDETLEIADRAAFRAASFVQGIKFQTRDLESDADRRFDLVSVISDSLLLLNHALRHAGCEVQFHHPDEPIELYGQPGKLAQIVNNLVTNAIDASRPKGGAIGIDLASQEGQIRLSVSDKGAGIGADVLPRIFEPMFTTKPFGEGTGLGLAIVHDIVVAHFGGKISVQSNPGQGTTFTCEFQAEKAHES